MGISAVVLNVFDVDHVPRVLKWIYHWGDTPARGIKIALIVVGSLLWLLSARGTKDE